MKASMEIPGAWEAMGQAPQGSLGSGRSFFIIKNIIFYSKNIFWKTFFNSNHFIFMVKTLFYNTNLFSVKTIFLIVKTLFL